MQPFFTRKIESYGTFIFESSGFIELAGKNIYVNVYEPLFNPNGNLILINESLLLDSDRSLSISCRLSRMIATQGYVVVRYDYTGTGNSDGETEDLSFENLAKDCQNILNWIKDTYPNHCLKSVISFRMGSYITLQNHEILALFEKFIFVHPMDNLKKFISRNYLQWQVFVHNRVHPEQIQLSDIQQNLKTKPVIGLLGFELQSDFLNRLMSIPCLWEVELPANELLFIFEKNYKKSRNGWLEKYPNVTSEVIKHNRQARWDVDMLNKDRACLENILECIFTFLAGADAC